MTKYSAFGTALVMDGDEIANVKGISGPGLKLDTEDVTTHDQATAWEEVLPTILRSGEVSVDLVFDPGDIVHQAALANLVGKASNGFEIWFPDSGFSAWSFDGYVTGFEPSEPVDGAITATMTIKITGEPSLIERVRARLGKKNK